MTKISHVMLRNPVVVPTGTKLQASALLLNIAVEEAMHSPELTIDSDRWITDALDMFERCGVSHVAVVENGEMVGIIRADDILHTYRFDKNETIR